MKLAAWLNYEAGVSLGEYDGEIRVHEDEAGNLWLIAWRKEPESGEPQRDEGYDGGLGGPQIEAFRAFLNARAARKPGDLFVTTVRNPDESPFGLGETVRFLGAHEEDMDDEEFYESLDGSVRGWISPQHVKPAKGGAS